MITDLYIRFMAPVVPQTAAQLFQLFDHASQTKASRVHLLISSPGGSVFHGLSIYNYLKGAPFETWTYNFGSVDSIGVVVFCAGAKRYSVPHARFLIHPVQLNFNGTVGFDEKQLDEHLKSLKIDQLNIARVIGDTTGKSAETIDSHMIGRTTLDPTEAKEYGLVHEIQSALFPLGAQLAVIGEPIQVPPTMMIAATAPVANAYTQSRDTQVSTGDRSRL